MESPRTNISYLKTSDFDEAIEIFMAEAALDFIQPLRKLDRAGHLKRLNEKYDEMQAGDVFHFSCRMKKTNELVALLNLGAIPGTERKYIGYIIRKSYWGQGLASELTRWLIQFGKEQLGYTELFATVEGNHQISKRILEKNGFKKIEEKVVEDCIVETYVLEI